MKQGLTMKIILDLNMRELRTLMEVVVESRDNAELKYHKKEYETDFEKSKLKLLVQDLNHIVNNFR